MVVVPPATVEWVSAPLLDSLLTALSLSSLKTWSVRSTVTVCGSHVKRVLTWSDCTDFDTGLFLAHFLLGLFTLYFQPPLSLPKKRDTITRTAADTEVLLPFAQDTDQASTAAPPDDERDLFGREEALRMDEEIMDFQWFEHVTWDSIKDLRGTTYVQPPTRFRFALQQAQHAILRAIIHNNPTSLASQSAWKALVLSCWLLLGRPAVNTSESNCAHFLDARSELFFGLRIGLLSRLLVR